VGTIVLDTSVVLGVLDTSDVHHRTAARSITEHTEAGAQFGLPASVLSEVLVSEARRGHPEVEQRRVHLVSMFGPIRPIDEEVAVAAAHLRAEHRSLRLPDALVIATGIVDDADIILTADKRWSSVDERVQVLTPGP
jgi:predicted nucleic acid-binding protein